MYETYKKEMRSILAELSFGLPHYENISWRLDVQVRVFEGYRWADYVDFGG